MKKLLAGAAGFAGVALVASVVVSRPLFEEQLDVAALDVVPIAPVTEALTFARYRADDGSLRLLLVTQFAGGRVTGLDLHEEGARQDPDPIQFYKTFGYETIAEIATIAAAQVTVDAGALELPFTAREHNIGVGANYREHARESHLEESPFLFPKFAVPTRFSSAVARQDSALLDYEAELGIVLLDDLAIGDPAPARLGLVLANEMTDRWALVRNFKPGAAMGTTGFADGKSRAGFAPIGPLLVIPKDFDAFYPGIELRLYLDGRLRQRDKAGNMMWRPTEILRQAFDRSQVPFYYRDGPIALLPAPNSIPSGTIVFSGTPAGVIFKPLNLWNPWVYLRPGNEVVVSANFLGTIRNRIE